MMNVSSWSIRNPIPAVMLFVLLTFGGVLSFSAMKIQAGRLAGDRVEVVSGLSADAVIVANGAGFLNDGDLVRISNGTPAAPPPAPDAKK